MCFASEDSRGQSLLTRSRFPDLRRSHEAGGEGAAREKLFLRLRERNTPYGEAGRRAGF